MRGRRMQGGSAQDAGPRGVADSFYFYDLETTGRDPRWHRIVQFAGIRTDGNFEPLGAPDSWIARPDDDVVPEPEALRVTGLAPADWAQGIDERALFRRIDATLSKPGTCVAGYNSLRFDDEFVRYGLWRTLRDPYAREWKSGNSRWDLIDLARMAAALRPDGMAWPEIEDRRSFRLEDLARANEIEQVRAHDATSDVLATLGLARALKTAQPRLVEFYLRMRDKRRAADLLQPLLGEPCIHVSGRYPGTQHHLAIVVAVAFHPVNRNAIIVADLSQDPGGWCEASADELREVLFAPRHALGDRVRPPLKEVHVNKVPALAPFSVLRPEDALRLQLDLDRVRTHLEALRACSDLPIRIQAVFDRPPRAPSADVAGALYDGFLADGDRRALGEIRDADVDVLAHPPPLDDPRARELAFEHFARSHPEALDAGERARFARRVRDRLENGRPGMESLPSVRARLTEALDGALTADDRRIFEGLRDHLDAVAARWEVARS